MHPCSHGLFWSREYSSSANLFKYKNFYDQMDSNPYQRLTITKAITELIDPSGIFSLIENRARRNSRFKDGAVVFYENDQRDISSHHNCLCMYRERQRCRTQDGCLLRGRLLASFPYLFRCRGCVVRKYHKSSYQSVRPRRWLHVLHGFGPSI